MTDPKFSVITVSYNYGEFIRQTIESVLMQRYPNFEHIIVDGGSSDDTVEILKAYPHLSWTSESDRGQSHALNKGFQRASGDIIAWINADDWYAPGIFKDVALALEEYPIVMGACEFTDRYGVRENVVLNVERNYFDLMKYWIYHSCPAQPAIFFRRHVLEEIQLAPGVYLDEDLEIGMDYDLWLRIAQRYPLSRRVNKVFAYFRQYETNKTGEKSGIGYRESARLFRRYGNHLCGIERGIAYIVPICRRSELLESTLASIAGQSFRDQEVVVVDYSSDTALCRQLKKRVQQLGDAYPGTGVRYTQMSRENGEHASFFSALNHGCRVARAQTVTCLREGDRIPTHFGSVARDLFEADQLALAFPFGDHPHLLKETSEQVHQRTLFKRDALFVLPFAWHPFVVRTLALRELGGLAQIQSGDLLVLRQLLFRLLYKGWGMQGLDSLAVQMQESASTHERELLEAYRLYLNAKLFDDLAQESANDPFNQVRREHGFGCHFPTVLYESAKRVLADAPPGWERMSFEQSPSLDQARSIAARYPNFAPAWYWVGRISTIESEVRDARQRYEAAKAAEGRY